MQLELFGSIRWSVLPASELQELEERVKVFEIYCEFVKLSFTDERKRKKRRTPRAAVA